MEVEAEKALKTLLPDLIKHLDPCLITSFLSKNLITEAERETIETKESSTLKISHLLTILRKRDNKKVMWTIISLLEGEHGEYKETHEVILNKIATAFPPYSYVCSNRFQTQRMLNPETLPEHQSYVTNVGNSRHFSESNVTQPNTGFPAIPMNTDSSLECRRRKSSMMLDKEQAISAAENLQYEFLQLMRVACDVVRATDADLLRLSVNLFFSTQIRQITPSIEQQLKEMDEISTAPNVLNCLVRKNFIGYLNYRLLKEFQKMVDSKALKECIDRYETYHDEFLLSISFNTLIEVFNQCPTLAPVSHIGLPEFEIHLEAPWNGKDVYKWKEFFELRPSWPPYLFVTGVSRMCIILTYAVLPIFVSSVVRDLTNPEVLRELEENGAKVQLSKELLDINDRISKPATNKQDSSNEHTVLSKQFSSSDGCVHVLGSKEHSCLMITRPTIERWNYSIKEHEKSTLHIHKVTGKLSVIDILHLEVTEKQLRSLLSAITSSGKHEPLTLTVKETETSDLSEADLPVGNEVESSDKHEFQREKLSSPLYQESDPILQALKSTSIHQVAHFFSLYDLHVTEQQKIQFLSLAATSESQFPIKMNPLKVLVSVIHDTESIIHKAKEALTKEVQNVQEKADMYKKISCGTIQELHAKEELIKKLESMKRDQKSEEEDVEIFHLKEDIPESKDEKNGEFSEEAQTTLKEVKEKADMYQKILLGTIQELEAKEEQIKKLESMKRDPHHEKSEEDDVETLHLEAKDKEGGETHEEDQKTMDHLREVADIYRKRSYIMIRELHAKETQIKQLQSMTVERHPELSELVSEEALHSKEVILEAKVGTLLEEVESYREMVSCKESDINELKSALKTNQDKLLALKLTTEMKASKDLGVQFDFTVPATDHLNGVHVAQQRLFLLQGDLSTSFSWEDYGFVLNFKQHSLPSTSMCDIVVSALIGGHFQFPEDTELVSAVYAMSFSKDISQPVRIDIQHCVSLKNEQQSHQLMFAIAPLDGGLPFHFEIIKGGNFPLDSEYGSLNKSDVTSLLIGILKLKNDEISIEAGNIYTGGMYYEKIGNNKWVMKFVVSQNIRVFLKYIENVYRNSNKDETVRFSFLDQENGYIELDTVSMEHQASQGWSVEPHKEPLRVTKRNADLFGSCDLPIPPVCLVTIWADLFSDPEERLRFPVTLTGIDSDTEKIYISRFLDAVETSHRASTSGHAWHTLQSVTDRSRVDTGQVISISSQVIRCIELVMEKNHAKLSRLFKGSVKRFADELLEAGIIPRRVQTNPTSDHIINCFLSGFVFKDDLEEIEEYCTKYFNAFYEIGGPYVDAANKIKKSIQETVRDKLGIQLNI